MVLEKNFCLQLTKTKKKGPFIYFELNWPLFVPTLKFFEHVQKIIFASAFYNVHQRMPAYEERTRRMPSVPLTYVCVYERTIIRWHTLMSYAVV